MNRTAKLEISVILAAITLGVVADALLRSFPWGLNFALWAGFFAMTLFFLGRSRREAFAGGGWWLIAPITLSPMAFLWHDSTPLKALNLLALLTALSLLELRAQGGLLRTSSLVKYALGSLIAGINAAFGFFPLLFGNCEWKKSMGSQSRSGVAVLRGAAFAFVPLLVFGSLLMAADAAFHTLVYRVFHLDFTQVVVIAFVTLCVGGYLRGLLFGRGLVLGTENAAPPFSLGLIEVGLMLGLLNLLFLAFVAVQIRYFFGGSALVQATTGLTYAEYARSGFFELVAVATLVLPFLLLVHWLLRADDARAQHLFRWLAGIEIALLFVIMASAVERMRLYVNAYGLSEQRLYPTAFMAWLAVVFVWFALTVMRGHRERFAFGAMLAGFLLIASLHLINPDALIARTNIERARAGLAFDAGYVAHLSADAAPDIIAGMPAMNAADRRVMAKYLLETWRPPENPDWRSWSVARTRAWKAVNRNTATLRDACAQKQK